VSATILEINPDNTVKYAAPFSAWDHIDIALLRERRDWALSPAKGHLVQLGAGKKFIEGYDNLDFPHWDAHFGQQLPYGKWKLPYKDETVSDVTSYFTLDHLEPWAVIRTLREIQRVLMVGGTFCSVVPHYSSQLANECIMHKSRFGVDTWRNIFSERQYSHAADGDTNQPWSLDVRVNFIYGITERNLVLVTQMQKVNPEF
jgi:hypothetical protein